MHPIFATRTVPEALHGKDRRPEIRLSRDFDRGRTVGLWPGDERA
jgi:hypothetical protein